MSSYFLNYYSEKVLLSLLVFSILVFIISKRKLDIKFHGLKNFRYSLILILSILIINSLIVYIIGLSNHIHIYLKGSVNPVWHSQLEFYLFLYFITIEISTFVLNKKNKIRTTILTDIYIWILSISLFIFQIGYYLIATDNLVPTRYTSNNEHFPILSFHSLEKIEFIAILFFIVAQFIILIIITKALYTILNKK